jgi:hypothetical protein
LATIILADENHCTGQSLRFNNQGSFAWLPSQNAPLRESLQPHHATVLASVISTFFGVKAEPLCEPSQNGCDFDWPQAHQ